MPTAAPARVKHPWAKSLAAAFVAGQDARRDGLRRAAGMDRYEDMDLVQAWRVGWDDADRELREAA